MKCVKLSVLFALALSVIAVGCGKSNSDQPSNGTPATVVSGAAVLPVAPGNVPTGTLPVGCYYNGTSSCAPCPTGYVSNGSYCTSNGAANTCGVGQFFNGYYCQQIGYYPSGQTSCPWGTSWSWYYYGCIGTNAVQSSCKYKSYLGGLVNTYVCY
ncbi:MAG: hypothetical protein HY075_12640 [Deltaproteobacteria bacterium]|nr:hypothetical protein [Deltaproteobacteria bacterium]